MSFVLLLQQLREAPPLRVLEQLEKPLRIGREEPPSNVESIDGTRNWLMHYLYLAHSPSIWQQSRLRELMGSGLVQTLLHEVGAARNRRIFLIAVLAADEASAAALTDSGIVEALCTVLQKASGVERLSDTERQWTLIALAELAARPCSAERVQQAALPQLLAIVEALVEDASATRVKYEIPPASPVDSAAEYTGNPQRGVLNDTIKAESLDVAAGSAMVGGAAFHGAVEIGAADECAVLAVSDRRVQFALHTSGAECICDYGRKTCHVCSKAHPRGELPGATLDAATASEAARSFCHVSAEERPAKRLKQRRACTMAEGKVGTSRAEDRVELLKIDVLPYGALTATESSVAPAPTQSETADIVDHRLTPRRLQHQPPSHDECDLQPMLEPYRAASTGRSRGGETKRRSSIFGLGYAAIATIANIALAQANHWHTQTTDAAKPY